MSDAFALQLTAFQNELEKTGAPAWLTAIRKILSSRAAGLGAGTGSGALVGAGGGAALGGGGEYLKAREEGASVGQALGRGAWGGVQGAAIGGTAGAALGGAGGAALLSPAKAKALTQMKGPIGAGARFGQRQVHGFTGWTPKEGLRSIRGGAYNAHKAKKEAVEAEQLLRAGKEAPSTFWQRLSGAGKEKGIADAVKKKEQAQKAYRHAMEAERMGLTSLPGYLKAVTGRGKYVTGKMKGKAIKPSEAFKTGLKEQWHGGGGVGKAFMAGYPAYAVGSEAIRASEPGEGSKLERMGKALGESAAYTLAPIPLTAQLAAAPALSMIGGAPGKLLGKKKKKLKPAPLGDVPAPPKLESESGQGVASQHIYTPSAAGQPSASMMS